MCSNNSKDDILKLCASLSSKYKKPQRLIENPILREDEYAAVKALEISYITDIDISSISPPVCLIWEELIHDAKKHFLVAVIWNFLSKKEIGSICLDFFLEVMSVERNPDLFWNTWEKMPSDIIRLTLDWIDYYQKEALPNDRLDMDIDALQKAKSSLHKLYLGEISRAIICL